MENSLGLFWDSTTLITLISFQWEIQEMLNRRSFQLCGESYTAVGYDLTIASQSVYEESTHHTSSTLWPQLSIQFPNNGSWWFLFVSPVGLSNHPCLQESSNSSEAFGHASNKILGVFIKPVNFIKRAQVAQSKKEVSISRGHRKCQAWTPGAGRKWVRLVPLC